MRKTARPKNCGTREVIEISDDESPGTVKKLKGDNGRKVAAPSPSLPPPPSPEVIELQRKVAEMQQKLDKSEKMFQKACRAAREAELRAEHAETQLDSKSGIVVAVKDDDSMKGKEKLKKEKAELKKENEELKKEKEEWKKENEELKMKLYEVSEQLKTAKAGSEYMGKIASEQTNLNRVLRNQLRNAIAKEEEDKKKAVSLANQIYTLTQDLKVLTAKDEGKNKKIAELLLARSKASDDISNVTGDKIRKLEEQNNSLKNELKRMRRKADLIQLGSIDETELLLARSKASDDISNVTGDKIRKLEEQNNSLKNELKRMRRKAELIQQGSIDEIENVHKEEMKVMRGKRDVAVRAFNELKTRYRSLKDSVEKERNEAKNTTTTLLSHHDTVLQSMYSTLQQQLTMINVKKDASDKTSRFLLNENAALKQELEQLKGQIFATYSEECPIFSMIVPPPPPPPPAPMLIENPSLACSSFLQPSLMDASTIAKIALGLPPVQFNTPSEEPKMPDIVVREVESEDMDVEE